MLNWLVFLVWNNTQNNITIFSLDIWTNRSICICNPLMSYCTIITDVTRSVKIWHAPYARGEIMVWYLKRDSRFWQPGVQVWGNDGWSRPLFLKIFSRYNVCPWYKQMNGFVVCCFVVVMLSNSSGYFTATFTILWLPQCHRHWGHLNDMHYI